MARIMIIDDEETIRDALSAVMEAAGHETCAVADGARGIAQLDTFRPDLVITDILMPDMEGMETIRELRRLRPGLPIIAMSGSEHFGGASYLRTAERLGADHSIPKPISPRALVAAVGHLLGTFAEADTRPGRAHSQTKDTTPYGGTL